MSHVYSPFDPPTKLKKIMVKMYLNINIHIILGHYCI
jgi:hypothetical protein